MAKRWPSAIATLAPADEAQDLDTYTGGPEPASVSSCITTSLRSPSVKPAAPAAPDRREIGHGALAERSIELAVIPPVNEEFPYAIRISS